MHLNGSLVAGVYDNVDLGNTRVGAALDTIPTFMTIRLDTSLLRAAAARTWSVNSPIGCERRPLAARRRAGDVLDDLVLSRSRSRPCRRIDFRTHA